MQSNNVGNINKCKPDQSEKEIEDYCISAYTEFDEIEGCKVKDDFCHACCDHEFGVMKLALRENCYNVMCGGPRKYWSWK